MAGDGRGQRPDRDAAYVCDIVDSCNALASYTRGKAFDDFRIDPVLQDAVARRLFLVGEAAKGLSEAFKRSLPEVDWKNIGRLRDKLAHHYWTIELEKIWELVTDYIPVLRDTLEPHVPPAID
jgi:uncharacterized protein with HEPN domain